MSEEEAKQAPEEEKPEAAGEADVKENVSEEAQAPAEPTLEEQLAMLNDRYLRLRAEFDNYRKRMAREAMETREVAKCNVVSEFVCVYDYFKMALDQANQGADANAVLAGLKMISDQFDRTLENLGVKAEDVTGQDFDPRYHEAISQEASDDVPEGKILRQWKCMFKLGERLVRPATVVVSSGPSDKANAEPSADEKKDGVGDDSAK